MSKKTIKQRISLVAVSALTAGVLTVTSAPTANAAAGDTTISSYTNLAKSVTLAVSADTVSGIIYANGSLTIAAAAGAGTFNVCVGLTGAKIKAAGDGAALSTVSAYTANTGSQTLMAPDATAIAGLVIEPLAAGTDLVITVGTYDIAAVANCLTNATRDSLTFTVLTGGASDGIATISAGSVCTASADDGTTALTAPYISASTGANLTVPVGGTVVFNQDVSDVAVITGPMSAINLDFDASAVASTVSLNSAGKVLLTNPGLFDQQVLLSALAVGSATIVVSADGGSLTPTSTRANTINITIVAACVTATVSDSYTVSQATTLTAIAAGAVVRGADVSTIAAGEPVSITAVVKNAYATAVASDTFTVTATNGALVNIDGSAISLATSDTKGTTSFDSATATGDDVFVRVDNPTGAALTTVVTISYAGQPVAVKTLTWRGEATKINVVGKAVGKTSGKGQIHYTLTDAAGNLTAGSVSGLVTSFGATVTSTSDTTNTGTATQPTFATTGKGASFASAAQVTETVNGVPMGSVITSATYGIAVFNCGATAGTADVTLRYYQPVTGAYISTPVSVSCAGGIDTYTVSSDKAAYNIGEVATFTITAKDSKGNPVHDYLSTNNAALTTGTAADISIGGGTLTKATTTSDTMGALGGIASGTATFKAQLTTEGTFNAVVNLAGSTTKSVTVSYKVNSSGAVSNADVLKSIVALIASINKQIQALQALILKKK
jgi:hypothetical protein